MGVIGACLMYTVLVLLNSGPNLHIIAVVGLLSYATYALNRVTDVHEDFISHTERVFFAKEYGKIMVTSAILAYFIVFMFLYPLGNTALLLAVLPLVAGLLYGVKWMPHGLLRGYKRLKEILVIKNTLIALVWAVVVVGLGVVYGRLDINITVVSVFAFVLVKVLINTIVFDIRDVEGDKRKNITTIPHIVGIEQTKKLLMVLNVLLGICVVIAVMIGWLPTVALFIDLITIYTHWYLSKIGKTGIKFLCDVIVEGEDIVMAMLAFIGQYICNA
jgi:4-hydroxybenzoate polyprenyltransferase